MKYIIGASAKNLQPREPSNVAGRLILRSLHSGGLQGKHLFLNSFPPLPGAFKESRAPAVPSRT